MFHLQYSSITPHGVGFVYLFFQVRVGTACSLAVKWARRGGGGYSIGWMTLKRKGPIDEFNILSERCAMVTTLTRASHPQQLWSGINDLSNWRKQQQWFVLPASPNLTSTTP